MKKVDTHGRIPIKMWLEDLEVGALNQALNLSNLPFAFKHIAIMPDAHQGYGMPIGSILATKNVIVPNAVGVDIGCGMCAVKTNLTEITKDQLKATLSEARKRIPVGFNQHKEIQDTPSTPCGFFIHKDSPVIKNLDKARYQVGTLGGGNHFIEIQKGDDGFIWIMIHSGSRKLGYEVAKHYNKVAIDMNKQYYSSVTTEMELAFLPINTDEAKDYMNEMQYCVEYALANRKEMMYQMLLSLSIAVPDIPIAEEQFINESHNFAAWENHFGSNVLVHRKGATKAYKGELGMIPGSQGTNSYIVRGLGEEQSFKSCSHGAGRKLGRKKAIQELDFEKEVQAMEEKGILHSIRNQKDLDEAPGAYKDIDTVMNNQKDLVEIVVKLTPLAVLKG